LAETRPQTWNQERIVAALQRLGEELGRPPLYNDVHYSGRPGMPSGTAIARHFGTFNRAMEAAGFPTRRVGRWVKRDEERMVA
jgi:hypothetical protein